MNPGRDALIIVGIFLVLGAAFFALQSGAGLTNDLKTRSFLPTYSGVRTQTPKGGTETTEEEKTAKEIEDEIAKSKAEIALLEEKIKEIETYGEMSPYKGMVALLKSRTSLTTTDVDREYIKLTANKDAGSGVNISNWKIESAISGQKVTIGKAVPLIFAGRVNTELPVVLRPGDVAYIVTGRSPIGYSFRVNKCSGYFTQFQTFRPTLRNICPEPEDEILFYTGDKSIFIDNQCMDFVDRMSRCRVNTKPLPLTLSYSCQEAIVEEINYNSCIDKHKNDNDFTQPEWRIYLKRNFELWREKRELIKLVDENGKTVDYYSY